MRRQKSRAELIREAQYEVCIRLGDKESRPTFESETVIRFNLLKVETTFLDLFTGEKGGLEALEINGERVEPQYNGARLILSGLKRGENTLKIKAGMEYRQDGTGLHRAIDPIDSKVYMYVGFEPFFAHKVFACFDQPDIKGEFSIRVYAPNNFVICSNSKVERVEEAGKEKIWVFKKTPPIATYLFAIIAGEYHRVSQRHNGIPISLYCRESLASYLDKQADNIFFITKTGLDFYEKEFGYTYRFDEYNQLFVPEFNAGAMESPGCVTCHEDYIFKSQPSERERLKRAEVILHEMAHVFGFGDVATMRWWGDLWLNETFATYMAYRALSEVTEFRDAWVDFSNTAKTIAAKLDQMPTTHPVVAFVRDTIEADSIFDEITYEKGASCMKQLVAYVGKEAFGNGVREYLRIYSWKNADLAEFLNCIERASGKDVLQFSKLWLENTGMNTLIPEIVTSDGKITNFTVIQEGEILRPHVVRVGLYYDKDGKIERRKVIEANVLGKRTGILELVGEENPAVAIVNEDDLTFAKLRVDKNSQKTVLGRLGDINSALTRSLLWAMLWDMTRDSELPASRFIEVICEQLPKEDDAALVERLLFWGLSAAWKFGSPSLLEENLTQLWTTAKVQAEKSFDKNSQISWARGLIACSITPEQGEFIQKLLNGEEEIQGLEIDNDLRWLILGQLSSLGFPILEMVGKEKERDRSDRGERRAAAVLAARPEYAVKKEAIEGILCNKNQNYQMDLALIQGYNCGPFFVGGIWHWGKEQEKAGRKLIPIWENGVLDIWKNQGLEVARAFTERLFPEYFIEEETLLAAKRVKKAIEDSTTIEDEKEKVCD